MKSSPTSLRVAIACGGTGGHLFPGMAVGRELVNRGVDVSLLISPKEVDQQAVRGLRDMTVLTLPAIALAATSVALVTRVTRAAVREELEREHVQTAVSRGLPWSEIVRKHVLRNAAIPITTVVGITIASLIALSAVVETAFGLNGLGAYLVQAAQNKDFAVVQGISLVLVVAFVVTNVVVDLTYALLDPRVALGSRAQ